jgi:hypothetical protein
MLEHHEFCCYKCGWIGKGRYCRKRTCGASKHPDARIVAQCTLCLRGLEEEQKCGCSTRARNPYLEGDCACNSAECTKPHVDSRDIRDAMNLVIKQGKKACVAMTLKVPCPFGYRCTNVHTPEAIPKFDRQFKAVVTKVVIAKKRPSPDNAEKDEEPDGEDHASRDAHKFSRGDRGGGRGKGKGGGRGGRP